MVGNVEITEIASKWFLSVMRVMNDINHPFFVLFPNEIVSREINFLTRQAKNAPKGGTLS